ncbi:MAG: hypothetical protein A2341_16735 [Deltaproteobacteria bacterium RIFOXYB12_FULL_58_9]|nr:MAG: hypothetical protein A2341_16735 [Deltaproteobacteria bacterium RIFOXYB12_FULL_58_9]
MIDCESSCSCDYDCVESCPYAQNWTARLHIQLTWDDLSSDQDLHLLYLQGSSAACNDPWDCYFSNKQPTWFPQCFVAQGPNPRVDIDDTFGQGPETISVGDPAPATYRIAVHYWADYEDHSPTLNAVRIYIDGGDPLVFHRTVQEEQMWWVADVTADASGQITVTPYASDVSGEAGTLQPFLRNSCFSN